MTPDLSIPLRDAILAEAEIATQLPDYNGSKPIFSRRPVPEDAPYPMVVTSEVTVTDQDGISDLRPVLAYDVIVYGRNQNPVDYRTAVELALRMRDLFHSKRNAITVPGWDVILITATGPRPAPVDVLQTMGRVVSLSVRIGTPH